MNSPTSTPSTPQTVVWREGVGGWLLFFNVIIGALQPFWVFILFVRDYFQRPEAEVNARARFYANYPNALFFDRFRDVVTIALSVAFIIAARRIRARKPGAVLLCRQLLLLVPALIVLEIVLAYFWIDSDPFGRVASRLFTVGVWSTFFAIIWTTYLARSRRVRNTFPNG